MQSAVLISNPSASQFTGRWLHDVVEALSGAFELTTEWPVGIRETSHEASSAAQGRHVDVGAELLSMAVEVDARGAGFGAELGVRFLDHMSQRGATEVRVVVGTDNATAAGLYRRLGFVDAATIEVHAGAESLVLVWQA